MGQAIKHNKIYGLIYGIRNCIIVTFVKVGKGPLFMQLKVSLSIALFVSPLTWICSFVRMHILNDTSFIMLLTICLTFDLVLGIWKHIKLHTFDWKRMYMGLIEKTAISFMGMIVFTAIFDIKEWNSVHVVKDYIVLVGKLANLLYVAGSAFNSMYVITDGDFPPIGWMNRIKKFNDTLDTDKITDKKV